MGKLGVEPQTEAMILENLGKSLQTLRDENPEATFDKELVEAICLERVFPHQAAGLLGMTEDASLDLFFGLFRQESSRQEFFSFYVVRWKQKHQEH